MLKQCNDRSVPLRAMFYARLEWQHNTNVTASGSCAVCSDRTLPQLLCCSGTSSKSHSFETKHTGNLPFTCILPHYLARSLNRQHIFFLQVIVIIIMPRTVFCQMITETHLMSSLNIFPNLAVQYNYNLFGQRDIPSPHLLFLDERDGMNWLCCSMPQRCIFHDKSTHWPGNPTWGVACTAHWHHQVFSPGSHQSPELWEFCATAKNKSINK